MSVREFDKERPEDLVNSVLITVPDLSNINDYEVEAGENVALGALADNQKSIWALVFWKPAFPSFRHDILELYFKLGDPFGLMKFQIGEATGLPFKNYSDEEHKSLKTLAVFHEKFPQLFAKFLHLAEEIDCKDKILAIVKSFVHPDHLNFALTLPESYTDMQCQRMKISLECIVQELAELRDIIRGKFPRKISFHHFRSSYNESID